MIDLKDYDVSRISGFLPSNLPLERLPQDYYQPWENLVQNLPSLILTKRIRSLVDKLPLLSTEHLEGVEQVRRAYQVLSFLAHGYVWGASEATNKLPEQIAKPLLITADQLQLPPLATYASTVLWNFKQIVPDPENLWDLDNLTTINTFTGGLDESWFFLVSVYFEYKSSFTIDCGMNILKNIEDNDPKSLNDNLQKLAEMIDHLGSVLMKMEEMCDPHIFYFRIRPFLAGWRNMADAGLDKNGVIYGNDPVPKVFAGGSNAQSSAIQFLDVLLNVKHYPTGQRPIPHKQEAQSIETESKENNFMNEMRDYMPGQHKAFLNKVEATSRVREYVLDNEEDHPELVLSYDACLAMLKLFRDKHIQIVTRYIILQAKQGAKLGSSSTLRSGLAKNKQQKQKEQRGTGGTALLPFLKQCRDETGDPAAGNWGKRILSDGVMRLNFSKSNGINED